MTEQLKQYLETQEEVTTLLAASEFPLTLNAIIMAMRSQHDKDLINIAVNVLKKIGYLKSIEEDDDDPKYLLRS